MRDVMEERVFGGLYGDVPVVWSWDYDGASDVLRTRCPNPRPVVERGRLWPRVTYDHAHEVPDAFRVNDFWNALEHVSATVVPAMVMSGSARILSQDPGRFEQDGLCHVAMQNEGLRRRGVAARVDRAALRLPYDFRCVDAPGYPDAARAKLDIVLRQIRHARTRLNLVGPLRFVFVDDIYAPVLAEMLARYPALAPPRNTTLHLVHFKSFADRRIPLSRTREVLPNVTFTPF